MAGIEHIVIHSKDYVVRWIEVPEYHSISWSVQPQKKSINFGIFKHPGGAKQGVTPILPTPPESLDHPSDQSLPLSPTIEGRPPRPRRGSSNTLNVVEKLQSNGLKSVAWAGRCEADVVSMGRYDVPGAEGGMYGLVFDNTFSKKTSKNVTFVLMTHPSNVPPKSGHHLHYSQAFSSSPGTSTGALGYSPSLRPINDSNDSLPQTAGLHRAVLEDPRPVSKGKGVESKGIEGTSFYTGVLHKKRRKKGQGYAKRFFSLDFTSSTLSYYRDRHSSALRGAVPLSLAAIGENEKTREFFVDSGAEVWHLKALNKKDFEGWHEALERASTAVGAVSAPTTPARAGLQLPSSRAAPFNPAEEHEWARVEELVSKVAGTRDAVRGLAKDTDPKYLPGAANDVGLGITRSRESSNGPSPNSNEAGNGSYFPEVEDPSKLAAGDRKSFWKRKPSSSAVPTEKTTAALFRRSVSAQLAVPSPSSAFTPSSPLHSPSANAHQRPAMPRLPSGGPHDVDVHERCMALLRDLDHVVADFAALIAESKSRRLPPPLVAATSRLSLDSVNEEFFDAEDGGVGISSPSQLLSVRRSSELDDAREEVILDEDSESSSDAGGAAADTSIFDRAPKEAQTSLFPILPSSLPPLPLSTVTRRKTVIPPKQSPPSIIGFLRKNAGKDLSTVSMPVTANEPTSLLQRLAENMEYSHLLDSASAPSLEPSERLLYVTAFAISQLSNNRVKERAIRKPFNPMLGETYELVREDLGFRFVAEKVSHRPVRLACHASSLSNGGWSFAQSPQPVQKFWGKSVELNTEGRAHVLLHTCNQHFSWTQPTCFLRNVIAGEKYVEPVQSMTVVSDDTTGLRAVATFKSGGMFSGRSEEVSVQIFSSDSSAPLSIGLIGKWTEGLKRTDTNAQIWSVGSLVNDAPKVYGFTSFAASLNQSTAVEDDGLALPPTDSRLRPDQRALESGEVDSAEALKAKLEERQRARRKVLETHGREWVPRFFEKVVKGDGVGVDDGDGEEVWRLKAGAEGYWERREKRDWSGIQEVFET